MDDQLLERFALSRNGFLPATQPLSRLPDPYYAPWEALVTALPALLADGQLRDQVRLLATLSTDRLVAEDEWRRAYVVLSFLTHAYIWGGEEANAILPPCLAVPLVSVSAHLELPPVATYAALNLWNFRSDSEAFDDVEKISALHTFTGTESESWFFVISVAMECRAAEIIPVLLDALQAADNNDCQTVTAALWQFIACIKEVGALLDRMHERCDPNVFFFKIRPFLAGSKNMAAKGLPNGVFYAQQDGEGEWMELRGGSNGQSSLIQFFDVVLGVEHTSNGTEFATKGKSGSPELGFHHEVRNYMPGPHRRFLEYVSQKGSLREFACRPAVSDEQKELSAAFKAATTALAAFRNKHLSIVARYIVIPSRSLASIPSSISSGSSGSVSPHETNPVMGVTGTGGTELLPFLKQSRDETLQAGYGPQDRQPKQHVSAGWR